MPNTTQDSNATPSIAAPHQPSAACASTDLSAIRQQAFDIDRQAGDIEILIAAVFGKIDDMLDRTPAVIEALNAINCFATCALRNAALIREAGTNILDLTSKGGEA